MTIIPEFLIKYYQTGNFVRQFTILKCIFRKFCPYFLKNQQLNTFCDRVPELND